jgi:hypothetical protein
MIFSKFNNDDVVVGRINQISSGIFGTNDSLYISQSTFTTSSNQSNTMTSSALIGTQFDVKNGQYYTDVYVDTQKVFSIAYGDYVGSGSSKYNYTSLDPAADRVLTNETKIIYSQYKNILLNPSDSKFSFATGSLTTQVDSDSIFAINFDSNLIKDQLDQGQFQINFSGSSGQYSFIDDSSVINKVQNVYNLISGSVVNGVPTPFTNGGAFAAKYEGIGLLYPSQGIIILNGIKLDGLVGINGAISDRANNPNSASTQRFGNYRIWGIDLFNSLKRSGLNMATRTSEFVPSTNYFVRIKNKDFNYTNNPTFVSDGTDNKSKGTILYQELINNPKTYITTIGLYNDNNELLAIGKLSKPTTKSFDNEILLRVRIDF